VSNAVRPRHYKGGTAPRATDNVDHNPLLQPNSNNEQASAWPTHNCSPEFMIDWVQAIDGMHATDGVSMISTLMSLVTRPGQHLPVLANGASIYFQAALPTLLTITTITAPHSCLESYVLCSRQLDRSQTFNAIAGKIRKRQLINLSEQTPGRWTEESRLLFGSSAPDRAQRVVNAILVLLVPPAIEEERITKEKQEKARLEMIQIEEERKKKEEEESIT